MTMWKGYFDQHKKTFVPEPAERVMADLSGFEEFEFYVHQYSFPGNLGNWRVTEATTGARVDFASIREQAIEDAKQRLLEHGPEATRRCLQKILQSQEAA